jgi:hypothetical protein
MLHIIIVYKAVPKLRRLVAGFPPRRRGFKPRSFNVEFVVDKVALRQVFSEYFDLSYQFSFHRLFHIHHHLSSGAGTIGQVAADIISGLSLTSPQKIKKKKLFHIFRKDSYVILSTSGVCLSLETRVVIQRVEG